MGGLIGIGLVSESAQVSAVRAGDTNSITIRRRIFSFALAVIMGGALLGFATAARADGVQTNAGVLQSLRDYAQQVATDDSQPATARQPGNDTALTALRAYAERLPRTKAIASKPAAAKSAVFKTGQVKLADADNAVDALRQFFNNMNHPAKPAATPAPKPAPAKPRQPVVQAHYVGTKVCLGCHTSQAKLFEHTMMGRLLKLGKLQCETCHGPGSEHVRQGGGRGVGGIISFRPKDPNRTAEQDNAICLGCHERGQRTLWPGSVHQERGLYCTNCHTIMKAVSRRNQLKTAWQPDTCFQCHKDRRAQMFESAHMPMRPSEGKVVCSDCHNPHGSFTKDLLVGDSINDTCYKCHAEKRGPFLFEHEPVRENCLNCHDPHGSIHQYMLKVARPRLCMECHSLMNVISGVHSDISAGQSCQNCHVNIHGSNSPNGALFFR